jgi:polyphosphate glucokinase
MKILTVDIGGTYVKVLLNGEQTPRRFESGPKLTPKQMVTGVKAITKDWKCKAISIGFIGPVFQGKPIVEPYNLGKGWVGFNYERAFKCPVKMMNDAAMQALGSYKKGKMLFLGLGTGLSTIQVVDGIVEPMELGHLRYIEGTFEDYLGIRGLEKHGKKRWQRDVVQVVKSLVTALEPNDVVLGGGNVKKLKELPPKCRAGDNANAFLGGVRPWRKEKDKNSTKTN